MKNFIIVMFLGLVACSREVPVKTPNVQEACKTEVGKPSETVEIANSSFEKLKVIDWGPQSTKAGVNPNAQPGGELGIWVRLSSTKDLGKVQLLFDGKPATTTTIIDDSLITAGLTSDLLNNVGEKDITLLQIQTGKLISIGVFNVSNN